MGSVCMARPGGKASATAVPRNSAFRKSRAAVLEIVPSIVLPNRFEIHDEVDMSTALTFTGRLYGETDLLALGHAYQ